MFEIAQSPTGTNAKQCERGSEPSGRGLISTGPARTDFLIYQRKEGGNGKAEKQKCQQYGLDDVDNVPRIPALGKRPVGANSITICVVEQDMTETRQTGIGKQYSPAGRKIRIASLATAQAPDPIDKGHYGGGTIGTPRNEWVKPRWWLRAKAEPPKRLNTRGRGLRRQA